MRSGGVERSRFEYGHGVAHGLIELMAASSSARRKRSDEVEKGWRMRLTAGKGKSQREEGVRARGRNRKHKKRTSFG